MARKSIFVLIMITLGLLICEKAMAESCYSDITAKEVLAAENARYAAQTKNDFSAMEKLFGDDLIYIHSTAAIDNKATYINSMKSGTTKYRQMKRSDVKVRTYGCVAIMNGLGKFDVTVKGQDLTVKLRFHSVWIKRKNGLEFVSWESTRIPEK